MFTLPLISTQELLSIKPQLSMFKLPGAFDYFISTMDKVIILEGYIPFNDIN